MRIVSLSLLIGLLAACGPQQPDQFAPDFPVGTGQQGTTVDYPSPTGYGVGSVIPNFQFMGYPRPNVDRTQLVQMQLADFYNPTGTAVYPDGSPYGAGTAKPLALVLDRSAVWCSPCNDEAKNVLPGKHAQYAPQGEIMLLLIESSTPGTLASQSDLTNWTNRYAVNYPGVLDPNEQLSQIVGQDAYPGNVIVRTKDMKIVKWVAGEPQQSFWDLYQKVIDGQPVLPGD